MKGSYKRLEEKEFEIQYKKKIKRVVSFSPCVFHSRICVGYKMGQILPNIFFLLFTCHLMQMFSVQ